MKFIVLLFIMLGYATCAKIIGRGLGSDESMTFILAGHLALFAWIFIVFYRAKRNGRVLTMDTAGWSLATAGAYLAGYLSCYFSSHR